MSVHATQVLAVCFTVSTLSYGFMGIIGYLMYGDTLQSQITLNLSPASVAAKLAIYTTLVNPLTKPVAEAAEGALGVSKSAPLRALVRTGLVVGTAVVALAVPFFADVVGLTGALLSCTATMLLPCLCYLKVRSKIGGSTGMGLETAACLAIVAVGAAIVGLGTYSSVQQIVRRL
jgi:vesicular inhibitory amino acid transporter